MVPWSPWWGEHRSRYHHAAVLAAGRTVLDVACGTGFGMNILSDAGAEAIVGVDLAWDALVEAEQKRHEDVYPLHADALHLPLADAAVDLITSFETIEHVREGRAFVAELRRVLRPDGVLLLSTPNALHTRPIEGIPKNPFHIREYEPEELEALLQTSFRDVRLFGQHTHPRYRISPFWQLAEDLPRGPRGRTMVWSWKIQNRMPFVVSDKISRLLHNRAFYPGEYDFVFDEHAVATAHVMVALCQR